MSTSHLHNRLQTHRKSFSKVRLSTLTLGREYFWLFPLRTPLTRNPFAHAARYGTAPNGCRQSSSRDSYFWSSTQQWAPRTFEIAVRQVTLYDV